MGKPFLHFHEFTVKVNAFGFSAGMTIFREQVEAQRSHSKVPRVLDRILQKSQAMGYEEVSDTVFCLDEFVASEADRAELIAWLRELMRHLKTPGFRLPRVYEDSLKQNGIPITAEHVRKVAYVYQTILDLIEGRVQNPREGRLMPPEGWRF